MDKAKAEKLLKLFKSKKPHLQNKAKIEKYEKLLGIHTPKDSGSSKKKVSKKVKKTAK